MQSVRGSELDELIAVRVMGWHELQVSQRSAWWFNEGGFSLHTAAVNEHDANELFTPSTDIRDAWVVVDELVRRGLWVSVNSANNLFTGEKWMAKADDSDIECHGPNGTLITKSIDITVYGMTAPLAICNLALKVVEATNDA